MPESDQKVFLVNVRTEKVGDDFFTPRVAIVQQDRRTYRTISFEMTEKLFHTEEAAIDWGLEIIREGLEKQYHKPQINFTLKTSTMVEKPPPNEL